MLLSAQQPLCSGSITLPFLCFLFGYIGATRFQEYMEYICMVGDCYFIYGISESTAIASEPRYGKALGKA
jgi:hypothetical protein